MSDSTKIQWADATFNPWIGCTKVSAGCKNCYAENTTRARVLRGQGHETWGKGAKRSRTSAATWRHPINWDSAAQACGNRPRIFPSLCDWLDDEVPIEWLADFLRLIHDTPHLTWLLLTKRPENFASRMDAFLKLPMSESQYNVFHSWRWCGLPENIWIGASVENQEMADKRIPLLLQIPARVRFLSIEPMLDGIDFGNFRRMVQTHGMEAAPQILRGVVSQFSMSETRGINWAIFGGESGPDARACNMDWIRDGVKQCQAAGVAAFVKQLGAEPMFEAEGTRGEGPMNCILHLTDPKGGDMAEWPADLRIREFPTV